MSLLPIRALVLPLLVIPAAVAAQEDAFPIPRGTIRLEAAGGYAEWDATRGDGGGLAPLGQPFSVPLTADNFAPLAATQAELNRFFGATGSGAGDATPSSFTLGELNVQAAAERTELPLRVEIGLTGRIALRTGVRIGRERVGLPGVLLSGGTLGVNPDPAGNAARLAAIDSSFAALGGASFLPLAGSALGAALQERVAARGGRLVLPDSTLGPVAAAALLAPAPERRWRVETAEAGLRLQLLGAGDTTASPRGIRAAVTADASVPLAGNVARSPLLPGLREGSTAELRTAVLADIGASRRLWATVAARFALRAEGETERFGAGAGFASDTLAAAVRVNPGDGWSAEASPRFQLTEEISFAGSYAYEHRGADAFADGAGLGERNAQTVGFAARYSTLPAWLRGESRVPFEAELRVRSVVAGSGGVPDATVLELRGSLFRRLWGRR